MRKLGRWLKQIFIKDGDQHFLRLVDGVQGLVAKLLSLALMVVIFLSVYELTLFLFIKIFLTPPFGQLGLELIQVFGLFLNILIALELLENIASYLKKHVVQVELVVVTALIAVARKIIVLDLEKFSAMEVIALAIAILCLSIGYWIIRASNQD